MSRFKEPLLLVGGIALISAVLSIANPFMGEGAADGKVKGPEVLVVNTLVEPVPTTIGGGVVAVTNLPEVQSVLVENVSPIAVTVEPTPRETFRIGLGSPEGRKPVRSAYRSLGLVMNSRAKSSSSCRTSDRWILDIQ